MTAYHDIKIGRRLIWAGIITSLAVALGLAITSYTIDSGRLAFALGILAVMSLPAAMALLSLDRRPSLLTAAAMAALIQGIFLILSGVGLLQLIPAILWYLAGQKRPRPAVAPTQATWARPLLALATLLPLAVMFVHLDPVCTVTAADGTVISSERDANAPSGWGFSLGGWGTSSADSDGATRNCESDTVRLWEAGLSLGVSAMVVGVATRWPTSNQLARGGRIR